MSLLINIQKRHFAGYIKKRITRLQSEIEISPEEVTANQSGPNDCPPCQLDNRNPRNLEQLLFEVKPLGWELEKVPKTFWNKVVLERYRSRLDAKVVHHSGRVLVKASTSEGGMMSQITSPVSVKAAEYLGQTLARRCLESGILYALNGLSVEEMDSPKTTAFLDGVQKSGLSLKEPLFIFPRRRRDL